MVQWDRGSVPYRGPHGSVGQGTGVLSPIEGPHGSVGQG